MGTEADGYKEQFEAIKDVWSANFKQELGDMTLLARDFPIIAIDTEFPGFCLNAPYEQFNSIDSVYAKLKTNADSLGLIQVGFSISDSQGNRPSPTHTWQFNIQFSLKYLL